MKHHIARLVGAALALLSSVAIPQVVGCAQGSSAFGDASDDNGSGGAGSTGGAGTVSGAGAASQGSTSTTGPTSGASSSTSTTSGGPTSGATTSGVSTSAAATSGSGGGCDPTTCLTMCFPMFMCGKCMANGCSCVPFDPSCFGQGGGFPSGGVGGFGGFDGSGGLGGFGGAP